MMSGNKAKDDQEEEKAASSSIIEHDDSDYALESYVSSSLSDPDDDLMDIDNQNSGRLSDGSGSDGSGITVVSKYEFNKQVLLFIDPIKEAGAVTLYCTSLRPDTVLGSKQGDHIIAHRFFLEFCGAVKKIFTTIDSEIFRGFDDKTIFIKFSEKSNENTIGKLLSFLFDYKNILGNDVQTLHTLVLRFISMTLKIFPEFEKLDQELLSKIFVNEVCEKYHWPSGTNNKVFDLLGISSSNTKIFGVG